MTSILYQMTSALISPETYGIISCTVNLEKDYQRYSFLEHHPEEHKKIDQLFQKTIQDKSGELVSVSSLLQKKSCVQDDLYLLRMLGFKQLSSVPLTGLVLEHPTVPGWLIKKNFAFYNIEGKLTRIQKAVSGSDFPLWVLPGDLMNSEEITFTMPNEFIHPLRVAMLERGRQWIKQLKLTNLQAVQEYLYKFPDVSSAKPLHERVVVISQKANILGNIQHLRRIATMANDEPTKLAKIVDQLTLLIKHWRLTDAHLLNFRFLNDSSDTLVAIDGEPIGALADATQPEMVKIVRAFDPNFYSVLALKKLQSSIELHMEEARINHLQIQKVQKIFDEKINARINEAARESLCKLAIQNCQGNITCYGIGLVYNTLRNHFGYGD